MRRNNTRDMRRLPIVHTFVLRGMITPLGIVERQDRRKLPGVICPRYVHVNCIPGSVSVKAVEKSVQRIKCDTGERS